MKKLIILVACLALTSCAVGRKVKYDNLKMNLSEIKSKPIGIALLDHREAIIDGSRKPDFVGYLRSNVGIAYPIGTESKNEFIKDLSSDIKSSLNRFNIDVVDVETKWTEKEEEVKSKLFLTDSNKKILLVFDELHSDGYGIQVLHYKVNFYVFDKNNELIKYKIFDADKKLGGNVAFGAGQYKRYMPEAIVKLFEDMFNDDEILKAINQN